MGTILIFIAIAFVIFYFEEFRHEWRVSHYEKWYKRFFHAMQDEWGGLIALLIIFGLLGAIVSLLVGTIFTCCTDQIEYNLKADKPIYALQDNAAYIYRYCNSGDMNICCVTEEKAGFHVVAHDIRQCFIKYLKNENEKPHMETYKGIYKLPFLNFLFIRICYDSYIYYIPEDSIISEYKIDLKGG